MKSNFSILVLLAVLTCSATQSFASPAYYGNDSVGNAAGAIVCRNAKGKITYAELYDLWEHRRLGISNKTKGEQETISKNIAEFIANLEVWHPELAKDVESEIAKVETAIQTATFYHGKPIPTEDLVELPLATDSKLIEFPARCPNDASNEAKYEQFVTYKSDDRVDVSGALIKNRPQSTIDTLVLRAAIYIVLLNKFELYGSAASRMITGIAASSKSREEKRDFLLKLFGSEGINGKANIYSPKKILAHKAKAVFEKVLLETRDEVAALKAGSEVEVTYFEQTLKESEQSSDRYAFSYILKLTYKTIEQRGKFLRDAAGIFDHKKFAEVLTSPAIEISKDQKQYGPARDYTCKTTGVEPPVILSVLDQLCGPRDNQPCWTKSDGLSALFNPQLRHKVTERGAQVRELLRIAIANFGNYKEFRECFLVHKITTNQNYYFQTTVMDTLRLAIRLEDWQTIHTIVEKWAEQEHWIAPDEICNPGNSTVYNLAEENPVLKHYLIKYFEKHGLNKDPKKCVQRWNH